MMTAPVRFSTNPSRAMTRVGKRPVLNMIVLGAVATGSMNAQLALIAAGTMSMLLLRRCTLVNRRRYEAHFLQSRRAKSGALYASFRKGSYRA